MNSQSRTEKREDVEKYIQSLKNVINSGAEINFQIKRFVDIKRDRRYTNKYTVGVLFPDENPIDALRRELLTLSVENYMRTVRDIKFPERSELREFGKVYNGTDDVYIKIRVELPKQHGDAVMFVMSFHFDERRFKPENFPYRKI